MYKPGIYICHDCAEQYCGCAIEVPMITFHHGECEACHEDKGICSIFDYPRMVEGLMSEIKLLPQNHKIQNQKKKHL
jgi:hypothetical protein